MMHCAIVRSLDFSMRLTGFLEDGGTDKSGIKSNQECQSTTECLSSEPPEGKDPVSLNNKKDFTTTVVEFNHNHQ
jgi:hypothetical protein